VVSCGAAGGSGATVAVGGRGHERVGAEQRYQRCLAVAHGVNVQHVAKEDVGVGVVPHVLHALALKLVALNRHFATAIGNEKRRPNVAWSSVAVHVAVAATVATAAAVAVRGLSTAVAAAAAVRVGRV